MQATKCVIVPAVCSQISGPVDSKWARQFASLLYWSRYRYLCGSEAASALAPRCAPSVPSAAGNIPIAARSLTLPPGLCHSAFAYRCTPPETCAVNRSRRRSGVSPMRSATREAFGDFVAERMRSNASGRHVRLLAEGEFEHVKGEEGALQTDSTQWDTEFLQHRVLSEAFGIGERHPLHHRRQHRCARLTDRATLALELHLGDPVGAIDLHMEDDFVPAQRVRVPTVLRGARERALVPRVFVVVQDLFLIHVVRDRHQAKTSWTFLMPATSASASSMSL